MTSSTKKNNDFNSAEIVVPLRSTVKNVKEKKKKKLIEANRKNSISI